MLIVALLRLVVLLLLTVARLILVILLLLTVARLLHAVRLRVGLLSRLLIHLEFSLLKDLPRVFKTRLSLLHALESVGDVRDELVEDLIGVAVGVVLQLPGILARPLHDFGFLLLRLT